MVGPTKKRVYKSAVVWVFWHRKISNNSSSFLFFFCSKMGLSKKSRAAKKAALRRIKKAARQVGVAECAPAREISEKLAEETPEEVSEDEEEARPWKGLQAWQVYQLNL